MIINILNVKILKTCLLIYSQNLTFLTNSLKTLKVTLFFQKAFKRWIRHLCLNH